MRCLIDLAPCDPAMGLAVEDALLESLRRGGEETIRLWVNARAIVIGRAQSVDDEVDEPAARRLGFPILRRISGGGAVVHYPGNLNVSAFVSERNEWKGASAVFETFGQSIVSALETLGLFLCGKDNGIYAGERKVGGAAQARRGRAMLYHSTVLVHPPDVPFDSLLRALRPTYRPSSIPSRPRAVISLEEAVGRPLSINDVATTVAHAVAGMLGTSLERGTLTAMERADATSLTESKYRSWAWNHRH